MMTRKVLRTALLVMMVAALISAGCSDSTGPDRNSSSDGSAVFEADMNPGGDSFVLQRLAQPVGGHPAIQVELVGSNLVIDPAEQTLSLDVSLRNAGSDPLYAPAAVMVHSFVPPEVSVLNAEILPLDELLGVPKQDGPLGFNYSGLLGDDGVLEPGEISGPKTWLFLDPGLQAFSFSAVARFAMDPDRPQIAGLLFLDWNVNGIFDAGDGPFAGGWVSLQGPEGYVASTLAGPDGRYNFLVDWPGLYTLRFTSMLDGPAECYTTPNPREVILPPAEDGEPQSFLHADFGFFPGPCPPDTIGPGLPVIITPDPPDSLRGDLYFLDSAQLDGDILTLEVGFSGCQPEHRFVLYISSNFMESEPVQTWALLAHDDLGEECDAAFARSLSFNLDPLRQAYLEAYGHPGQVIIHFQDYEGQETDFLFGP